jgi:hypothetical protein
MGIFENLNKLVINDSQVPYSSPAWPNVNATSGSVYPKAETYQPIPIHS